VAGCGFTAMCYAEFASRVPEVSEVLPYVFSENYLHDNRLGFNYGIFHRKYLSLFHGGYFYKSSSKHLMFIIPEWLTINYKSAQDAVSTKVKKEF
jgi:hypothetical protein